MGWRDILLGLIVAIVAYMVWLLWRMRNLSRRVKKPSSSHDSREEPRVIEPPSSGIERDNTPERQNLTPFDEHLRAELKERFNKHFPRPAAAEEKGTTGMDVSWQPENSADFARQAFMDGVEREQEQMREEIDALRGALAALREELANLREEFQQETLAFRAAQNASPLYSDAMQMAILGHDALTISERCGIARAEADLVVSLIKNKDISTS
jgi:hypothetical protein